VSTGAARFHCPHRAGPTERCTLLWASQTGNTESLTERYATRLMESGFEIRSACMADYDVATLWPKRNTCC
jgi:sulfite reductase alpha subunit-like flavoprotein